MFWQTIHDNTKMSGIGLALIAAGAMGQSIIDKSASLPWLHQQAAVAHKLQTVDIPKIKSVAGCQTVRAEVATQVAEGAEAGANVDVSQIPNCPKLPTKKIAAAH